MAYPISIQDINDICPESEAINDGVIQMYIDTVAQADACLDASLVPNSVQKFLKSSAVCHLIARSTGGTVKSESDMDGASVTFDTYKVDGYGLTSTTFGQNVYSSLYSSCFDFMNAMPNRFIRSMGR